MRSIILLAGALALSACARPMTFQANLNGASEVPPTSSRGTGTVTATVYPSTMAMSYSAQYQNLTGPATAAHFHSPAPVGANAPVVIPVDNPASPISGGATLTDRQLADLQAGTMYFNVHTAANPGGEIRGQVVRVQ